MRQDRLSRTIARKRCSRFLAKTSHRTSRNNTCSHPGSSFRWDRRLAVVSGASAR